MREKITLVLTTMFLAIFLTACSTEITAEEYKKLESVASEIKNAEADYQLPEGYTVEYSKNINTITITTQSITGCGDYIKAVFDITKSEPELIEISQGINAFTFFIGLLTVLITLLITMVLFIL